MPMPMPGAPLASLAPPALSNSIEPEVGQILSGVALMAIGLWLLIAVWPQHQPMSPAEQLLFVAEGVRNLEDRTGHWWFRSTGVYYGAQLFSALLALAGLERGIRGATSRPYQATTCHRCKTRVMALRSGRGLRCPNGDHATKPPRVRRWLLMTLLGLVSLIALLAVIGAAQGG